MSSTTQELSLSLAETQPVGLALVEQFADCEIALYLSRDKIESLELPDPDKERLKAAIELADTITSPEVLGQTIVAVSQAIAESETIESAPGFFQMNKAVDVIGAKLAGRDPDDNRLTKEYTAARKGTILAVVAELESIRMAELDPQKPITTKTANALREIFLGGSSNITDYMGGLRDDIDVLGALSRIPELRSAYITKCHGVSYELAFSDELETVVGGILNEKPTYQQLEGLRILDDITRVMQYDAGYDSADIAATSIGNCLRELDTTGWSWMASRRALALANQIRLGQGEDDMYELSSDVILAEQQFAETHRFDGDYAAFQAMQLAPGILGARSKYGLIEAAASVSGEETVVSNCQPLKNILETQGIYATDEQLGLFQELHEPGLQGYIEWQLGGIQLAELPLDAQFQLVVYAGTRTQNEFDHLANVMQLKVSETLRPKLLEAFLATEFGDDYGDSLLAIAEQSSPEQAEKVFDIVNSFRQRTKDFSGWFHDYDPGFAKATERAMNERLTDALTALEELATKGTLSVDVAPHRNKEDYESDGRFMCTVDSLDEGIEIFENLNLSMQLMHDVITAEDVVVGRVNKDAEQFIIYRFSSMAQGDSLLYIRPEGAKGYDKQFEYGNRKGVEASISFITNPKDPHHLRSDKDPDAISIRFDREGRLVDDSPFAEDRDPTRTVGAISVDISSGLGDPARMPVKIGRLISAGNILRAQKVGSHESLHHNMNFFDQKRYGNAGGFAQLAIYTAHMAEALMYMRQHGSHGSTYRGLPGILNRLDVELAA